MNASRGPSSLPGAWLEAIARVVFDEPALSHAALPTIADFQQEWIEAGANRGRRWLARWRGYVAFWSLVVMAPIVFRRSPGQGRRLSARTRRIGIGVVAVMAVIAGGANMKDVMNWVTEWMPRDAWPVIGGALNGAFLAGPLAIAVVMLRRGTAASELRSLHMSAAMLFSLLSVTVAALLVAANVVGLFHGISERGSAGLGPVTSGVADSAVALRNGLLMALTCLAAAGAMSLRVLRHQDGAASVARPAMSGSLALGLSGLLGVILIGVDQLLRAHHEAMGWLHVMIDPMQFRPGGRVHAIADGLESSLSLLLVGARC